MKYAIIPLMLLFACLKTGRAQVLPSVSPEDFSTRQVHLDFHTSEHLTGIGEKFDKEKWQEALKGAKVNSINIFAKGHHGWTYYPSRYGKQHPNLDFDLLGAQIAACHEIGVKCPLYFTIGWSVQDALEYPEWVIREKDGKSAYEKKTAHLEANDPFPKFTWPLLMPEGAYLELILKQTEELCENYDIDGFWYDIIPINTVNYNAYSLEGMMQAGIDTSDEEAVNAHHVEKIRHFMTSCNAVIRKHHPEASIFYNWSTHMDRSNTFRYRLYEYNTAHDLEDLPTTWQGYDVFPLRAKYFSNTGRPITGMSGKFHTAWGEFGGFKYPDALKYEAASMISYGANVNFGDQLHPSGEIDPETYQNIGRAYDYVEKIEAYGPGGEHTARTGLWMTMDNEADQGASLLLLETQTNYVVVNNLADWSALEVIIIPSRSGLAGKDLQRFGRYLDRGGKLLILGEGAMNEERSGFVFDVGGSYSGEAAYDIDYTVVTGELAENVVKSPFLNYLPAFRTVPEEGSAVLASIREPYFSRTKAHYTSHQNTPYRMVNAPHPAVLQKGNVIMAAHPLDRIYKEYGSQVHRELFRNILDRMLLHPMVRAGLPSAGRVNLLHFPEQNRYVVHLLYGPPIQRGMARVIEDLVPLYDVEVTLDVDEPVRSAYTVPGHQVLDIAQKDSGLSIVIPEFSCHTAIVFEY
jgi:hypothetical protein